MQKSIALSSAEAEYLSLTGATSEALNIHSAIRFLTAAPFVLTASPTAVHAVASVHVKELEESSA